MLYLPKSASSCKSKWTLLQTQTRKLFNKSQKQKSGSSRSPYIKWEYNKVLYFLELYFTTGKSVKKNLALKIRFMIFIFLFLYSHSGNFKAASEDESLDDNEVTKSFHFLMLIGLKASLKISINVKAAKTATVVIANRVFQTSLPHVDSISDKAEETEEDANSRRHQQYAVTTSFGISRN